MAANIGDAYVNWIYSHVHSVTGVTVLPTDSSSAAFPALLKMSSSFESAGDTVKSGKVGIIGARMRGLYAGLLLKKQHPFPHFRSSQGTRWRASVHLSI